jgi:hypothetical protein
MHQAGANSEDSNSAIEPINTSSANPGEIVRPRLVVDEAYRLVHGAEGRYVRLE